MMNSLAFYNYEKLKNTNDEGPEPPEISNFIKVLIFILIVVIVAMIKLYCITK